jgi:thioredoxin-dependent peroxiredoxin
MKTVFAASFIFLSFTILAQNGLSTGDKVPFFSATADDGSTWKLKNNTGDNFLVIYFYPAAMTGGCTAQACAYRDLGSELESQNARVVGISGDKPENLQFFKKAHDLNFTLLSDSSGEIAELFGVPTRSGAVVKGEFEGQNFELERDITTSRWTFIIDKNRKVVYKNEQVKASEDSQEVVNFLRNNS